MAFDILINIFIIIFLEKVIGVELFSTINLSMMLLLLFHTFSRIVSAAH